VLADEPELQVITNCVCVCDRLRDRPARGPEGVGLPEECE